MANFSHKQKDANAQRHRCFFLTEKAQLQRRVAELQEQARALVRISNGELGFTQTAHENDRSEEPVGSGFPPPNLLL